MSEFSRKIPTCRRQRERRAQIPYLMFNSHARLSANINRGSRTLDEKNGANMVLELRRDILLHDFLCAITSQHENSTSLSLSQHLSVLNINFFVWLK